MMENRRIKVDAAAVVVVVAVVVSGKGREGRIRYCSCRASARQRKLFWITQVACRCQACPVEKDRQASVARNGKRKEERQAARIHNSMLSFAAMRRKSLDGEPVRKEPMRGKGGEIQSQQ